MYSNGLKFGIDLPDDLGKLNQYTLLAERFLAIFNF